MLVRYAVEGGVPDSVWTQLVDILKDRGVPFEAGLSDAEADGVEAELGFRFPSDLRDFLRAGLPVGEGFPNWRREDRESLRERLAGPVEGVLFDVGHNGFWLDDWGPRPPSLGEAQAAVRRLVAAAPVLVPVYSHRMMPDRPHVAGNPIFSVHQTDIIYYGTDLRDYLIHEFLADKDVGVWPIPDSVRRIEFWDIERFLSVRWSRGYAAFDNRKGVLP
jgi:hypothetical protein